MADIKKRLPEAASGGTARLVKLGGFHSPVEMQKKYDALVKNARAAAKTRSGVSLGKRVEFSSGSRLARAIAGTGEAKTCGTWQDTESVALIADRMLEDGVVIRGVITNKKGRGRTEVEPLHPSKQTFEGGREAMYIWTFDARSTLNTFLGFLIIAAIIVGCMLPLWPNWMRVAVWYVAATAVSLLGVLAVFLLLRLVAFVAVWAATGGNVFFWILPNFIADVDFLDSFKPWYSTERADTTVDASPAAAAPASGAHGPSPVHGVSASDKSE